MCMPTGKEKCLEPFNSSTFFKTKLKLYSMDFLDGLGNGVG
jgi:hypothetical protein